MTKTLEFFFDLGSAYTYLATTQVEALATRTGAILQWRPFLLGGVFKETGNDMPARIPAKAQWMLRDLSLWAAQYQIPFQMPSSFPISSLRPQRAFMALANDQAALARAVHQVFRAYWAEDKDPSDPAVLRAALDAVGVDGEATLRATEDPGVKARLKANTDEAVARGAFGAPTFFVGDQMFWGNDRLHFVEACLRP